jgi:hypothetical protein
LQECLALWARSPTGYAQLRGNGLFVLPSISTLQHYKNSFEQKPGIQPMMLDWMVQEAARSLIPKHGYCGGLMFDEVSIQPDLQLYSKRVDCKLSGFIDMGEECNFLYQERHDDLKLATHVIQFFFLGDTGFRFPVAHYPTQECVASELYVMVWDAIEALMRNGFFVNYISMDGSSNNRAFLKMHFPDGDPCKAKYTTKNIHDPSQNVVFIMDPSHEMKKIRNSLLKSGTDKKTILYNEMPILWRHWQAAYHWDQESHGISKNHKLTREHVYLDQCAKMRNRLANEVLDKKMREMMEDYRAVSKRTDLESTIKFLQQTEVLVKNFTGTKLVRSIHDESLQENREVLFFFQEWYEKPEINHRTNFLTRECYEDLLSMLIGFEEVVKIKLQQHPMGYMCPGRTSTDVIENFFSSQRGINGSNNNPTYLQYAKGINTILMSRKIVSTKTNAGGKVQACGALPYKLHSKKSFRQLRM